MEASGTLDLTLLPEASSVAEARTRVVEAVGAQLDDGQMDALRLLVSEVVTNAVRHGGHDEPFELHAHWNSEVRIEVTDHGNGFTPAPRAGAPDEPGGCAVAGGHAGGAAGVLFALGLLARGRRRARRAGSAA